MHLKLPNVEFPAARSLLEASSDVSFEITLFTALNHETPSQSGNYQIPAYVSTGYSHAEALPCRLGCPKLGRQLVTLTVKGPEVDGEPIGLAKALPTLPADVRLVPCVGSNMA